MLHASATYRHFNYFIKSLIDTSTGLAIDCLLKHVCAESMNHKSHIYQMLIKFQNIPFGHNINDVFRDGEYHINRKVN